ncbi:MAG: hypothetical protein ACMXYL_02200 [Candidatus Woesearchaeota archaeon]
MVIQIKRTKNIGDIHYYYFENTQDTHNKIINFLQELDFDKDSLLEVDTPFLELSGECIFVENDNMKIHFFICNSHTWMVLDSKMSYDYIKSAIQTTFIYPK